MLPSATCADRQVFAANLNAYRENALSTLFNFKAPAFFKVEACNDQGCSDQSVADAGQAEFIHTDAFSEVAQLAIPSWGYANLIALADSPPGTDALSWCGVDICGAGGGMVMGRLDASGLPMVDVYYENYYEAWDEHPNAYFYAQGWIGGQQQLIPALYGEIYVSGEFDLSIGGVFDIHMFAYTYIGGTTGNPNDGYVTVTYNGESYQFTLPVQPLAGQSVAAPPSPVDRNDADYVVDSRATAYPTPFVISPPAESCLHCAPGDPAATQCDRIPSPQPTRP
jgi:hypothetical protein